VVDGTKRVFGLKRKTQIEVPEEVVREPDLPLAIGLRAWAQAEGKSGKRSPNVPGLVLESEEASRADGLDGCIRAILQER
jgi:hypothetical protein